jgi:hypothetical protein
MTKRTSAPALTPEIQDAMDKLRDISMYELAELVHNERTAAPLQAQKNPLVQLYEQYVHAVASYPAVDRRRRLH